MNAIRELKRNHSKVFVTAKDAHYAWKQAEKRMQHAEKRRKDKSISKKRKQRGCGYATPNHFTTNFECLVEYNFDTRIHQGSIQMTDTRSGETLLSCQDSPLYICAKTRGISIPRYEDYHDHELMMRNEFLQLHGCGTLAEDRVGSKEIHERWSSEWD